MNQFFSSVFTRSDEDFPSKEPINGNAVLDDFEVTEERVKSLIDAMRENAAAGPDKIPPIILKMLQDEAAAPV